RVARPADAAAARLHFGGHALHQTGRDHRPDPSYGQLPLLPAAAGTGAGAGGAAGLSAAELGGAVVPARAEALHHAAVPAADSLPYAFLADGGAACWHGVGCRHACTAGRTGTMDARAGGRRRAEISAPVGMAGVVKDPRAAGDAERGMGLR